MSNSKDFDDIHKKKTLFVNGKRLEIRNENKTFCDIYHEIKLEEGIDRID